MKLFISLKAPKQWIKAIAFSPDGTQFVTGSMDKKARVWNLESGACLATLEGHEGPLAALAFSPDGKRIVTGCGQYDKTAKVWDATTGDCILTLEGHTGTVVSVAFSPDGQRIATKGSYDIARVWDAASGECLLELAESAGRAETLVAFSSDGQRIVTSGYEEGIVAQVWDAATGELQQTNFSYSDGWYAIGKQGLVNSGGVLRLLEVKGFETREPKMAS